MRTWPSSRFHSRPGDGSPKALQMPSFQGMPLGTVGHSLESGTTRADGLPYVHVGGALDQDVGLGQAGGDPELLGSGHQVVDQDFRDGRLDRVRTVRWRDSR